MPTSARGRGQLQQKQQSVIQQWALVRPATLQDLLACQRGPHQATRTPARKTKAATARPSASASAALGLVAGHMDNEDSTVVAVGCRRRPRLPTGWPAVLPGVQQGGLGSTAIGAKTATTGPLSRTGQDPSPELPRAILHARRSTGGTCRAGDSVVERRAQECSLSLYQ